MVCIMRWNVKCFDEFVYKIHVKCIPEKTILFKQLRKLGLLCFDSKQFAKLFEKNIVCRVCSSSCMVENNNNLVNYYSAGRNTLNV